MNPEVAFELARRVTSELGRNVAVGHDSRSSSHVLKAVLSSSFIEAGASLRDYGMVPTPALSYETSSQQMNCGIMITASHNPPQYNGFKVFNSVGEAFDEESSFAAIEPFKGQPVTQTRPGITETLGCSSYENALSKVVFKRDWRVVLDPGNGAASELAPRVYAKALKSVTSIDCIPEPDFAGRGSEPTTASMRLLCSAVRGARANAGIAFDGDGDRMFMIDEKGVCHLQDRVLAAYILFLSSRSKGPFLVPLDVSMCVDEVAKRQDATVVRGPVGDAKLLREMRAVGGTFAGEPSGAWIHPQFNPCPDGLLSGLLFLQAVENEGQTVSQAIEEIPEYYMIRESIPTGPRDIGTADLTLGKEIEGIVGQDATSTTKFGLRVSSDQSWVLVRRSGTEPVLRVTAESKTGKETARIMRETLRAIRRTLRGML